MTASPERSTLLLAGPLEVSLEQGALRSIRMGNREVLTGIYAAVRDPSWGTIEAAFTRYDVRQGPDGFILDLEAACRRGVDDVDITWAGSIVGRHDGSISFSFDALVRKPFARARIGLCVLHPLRLAGTPIEVTTPWGQLRGRFPTQITAHLPFSNVTAIRQEPRKRSEIEIQFEGDLFQTEDQRAFTDASFKTFSTPLELPWPVLLDAGTRIHQAVHVRPIAPRLAARMATRSSRSRVHTTTVEIGAAVDSRPLIGAEMPLPEVGVDAAVVTALQGLRLDFLRVVVDGSKARADIERAAALAAILKLPVALGIAARAGDGNVARAVRVAVDSGTRLERVSVFDQARHTTSASLLGDLREALKAHQLKIPAGGGSRAYVYQLVLDGVPADVDFVEYAINPQVHATDDRSILETIDTLPATVATARHLGGGAPVHVAPASMRPRLNPDLVGAQPSRKLGEPQSRYDARQADVLPATWTLASLAELASEGIMSVSVHDAAGWGGLVAASHRGLPPMRAGPGGMLPVGMIVAAVTELPRARVCATSRVSHMSVLALEHDEGWRILAASREQTARRLVLRLPRVPTRIAAATLAAAPETWQPIAATVRGARTLSVALPQQGVARIDVA